MQFAVRWPTSGT